MKTFIKKIVLVLFVLLGSNAFAHGLTLDDVPLQTDTPKTILRHVGQQVTMEMFEDLNFDSSDTYQWFKNGVALTGQTYRTLILSNLNTSHTGIYTCKAYHTESSNMSQVVLEREPITLTVDTASYTCTNYFPFFTTKGTDGQPYRCGTIIVLPQLSNTDKIAEIKWTIRKNSSEESLLSNQIIPNIEISQYGVYQIYARIVDINGCEYFTGYSFEVIDCAVCEATISGEIVLTDINPYSCGRRDFRLSFSNSNDLILNYEWRVYRANGDLWYTDNQSTINTFFDNYGINRVELFIKNNRYECQTRTLSLDVPVFECKNTCPIPGEIKMLTECELAAKASQKLDECSYTCGNRSVYFNFSSEQEVYPNSTFLWVFKDKDGNILQTLNSSSYYVPFTFTTVGNNTVELTITTADGCPTVFTPLVVPVTSCNTPCTPIIGEIKVTTGNSDLSQEALKPYYYAINTLDNPEINSWVDYIDTSGVQRRANIGALGTGCHEIIASSIINTSGVSPCNP